MQQIPKLLMDYAQEVSTSAMAEDARTWALIEEARAAADRAMEMAETVELLVAALQDSAPTGPGGPA